MMHAVCIEDRGGAEKDTVRPVSTIENISDFMIKFKYEEPKPVKEITRDELRELDDDELDEYFYSRRAYNEGIGKKKAYYRAA